MDPIRKSRIESAIIRTLASHFVSGKVKDPRIQLVSIHRASISPDLSLVKVWVTSYCDEKGKKRLLDALKHASGYLQSVISNELKLRETPKLLFIWDEEYIKSLEVNELIDRSKPALLQEEES